MGWSSVLVSRVFCLECDAVQCLTFMHLTHWISQSHPERSALDEFVVPVQKMLSQLSDALAPSPVTSLQQTKKTSQFYDLNWLYDECISKVDDVGAPAGCGVDSLVGMSVVCGTDDRHQLECLSV